MWLRKRLDIRWSDFGGALRDCVTSGDRTRLAADLQNFWSPQGDALACLSVRSGFDLWLASLGLPPGSEVLVSAITIRDMVRIIEAHGLVPVPVDIDPDTLAIDLDSLQQAISPRSRLILVAHLFGTRQPLADVLEIARQHHLLVAEDCAQAFAGRHYTGDPRSDVTMFSFGPIKTATALGGALLCVRDRGVLARMRKLQASYPIQQRGAFVKRVFKYALMKLMSYGPLFGGLVWTMRILGRDPDQLVTSSVRGFPGAQLLPLIRRQPSAPLLALVHRRIALFNRHSLERRTSSGQQLMSLIGGAAPSPGAGSEMHSFWVFPVVHDDPEEFSRYLWNAGFDASRAHSLFVVPPPANRPTMHAAMAEEMLPLIVHLPCYPEMPRHELRRLARKVQLAARAAYSWRTLPASVNSGRGSTQAASPTSG